MRSAKERSLGFGKEPRVPGFRAALTTKTDPSRASSMSQHEPP